jgi:hypothetical protein
MPFRPVLEQLFNYEAIIIIFFINTITSQHWVGPVKADTGLSEVVE